MNRGLNTTGEHARGEAVAKVDEGLTEKEVTRGTRGVARGRNPKPPFATATAGGENVREKRR